jgi:putative flippase GtrA
MFSKSDLGSTIALLARFGLVGLINTAVGLSIIAALDLGLRVPPALANAAGYLVGICVSFVLSRRFVFRSRAAFRSSGPRYLIVVISGFGLNQLVLRLAGQALGGGEWERLAAQLAGMTTYTVFVFVASRWWVFHPARKA